MALVVDDEPLVLLDTSDAVADAGYHVVVATNDALALLEHHRALALLVTDVQMPGSMDGIALAGYVREHWPSIRIIVVSGAAISLSAVLPAGARFINKPIDHLLVLRTLREFQS